MEQIAQRYLKQVAHALTCPREDRERLLSSAQSMLEHFEQENPDALSDDYVSAFGPPADFAQTLLSRLDPERVAQAVRRQKELRRNAAAAVASVLLIIAAFALGRWSAAPAAAAPTPAPTASQTSMPTPEPTPTPEPVETPDVQRYQGYLAGAFIDASDISQPEAVAALHNIGVIDENWGKKFNSDWFLRRDEAAALIARAVGGEHVSDNYQPSESPLYLDLEGHWAEAEIALCCESGLMHAANHEYFDLDGTLTGAEFVKLCLVALGYDPDVYGFSSPSTWFSQVEERAIHEHLYDGLEDFNSSLYIRRGDAARILYNALGRPVVATVSSPFSETKRFVQAYQNGQPLTLLENSFGYPTMEDIPLNQN